MLWFVLKVRMITGKWNDMNAWIINIFLIVNIKTHQKYWITYMYFFLAFLSPHLLKQSHRFHFNYYIILLSLDIFEIIRHRVVVIISFFIRYFCIWEFEFSFTIFPRYSIQREGRVIISYRFLHSVLYDVLENNF